MVDILRGLFQNPEDREAKLKKEVLKCEINKLLETVKGMDSLTYNWIPRDIKIPKQQEKWEESFPILRAALPVFFEGLVEPQYMQADGWPFYLNAHHLFGDEKKIVINYEAVGISSVRARVGNLVLWELGEMTRLQIVKESLLVVRNDFQNKLDSQLIGGFTDIR